MSGQWIRFTVQVVEGKQHSLVCRLAEVDAHAATLVGSNRSEDVGVEHLRRISDSLGGTEGDAQSEGVAVVGRRDSLIKEERTKVVCPLYRWCYRSAAECQEPIRSDALERAVLKRQPKQ